MRCSLRYIRQRLFSQIARICLLDKESNQWKGIIYMLESIPLSCEQETLNKLMYRIMHRFRTLVRTFWTSNPTLSQSLCPIIQPSGMVNIATVHRVFRAKSNYRKLTNLKAVKVAKNVAWYGSGNVQYVKQSIGKSVNIQSKALLMRSHRVTLFIDTIHIDCIHASSQQQSKEVKKCLQFIRQKQQPSIFSLKEKPHFSHYSMQHTAIK